MRSILTFALFFALPAMAKNVKLEDGTRVALEIQQGTSRDVFVLVNGLVYATERWDEVASELNRSGATVIRYALPGQPENLRLLTRGQEPAYFAKGLDAEEMVENLRLVLKAAHVDQPVHLVGLSYGASVAAEFALAHPTLVSDVTFIAPLVVPTDEYDPRGLALRQWLDGVRFWENSPCSLYGAFNPYLCAGQDFWFDTFYKLIYESYLEKRVQTIPPGVEPEVYKKSLFHLVRAARDFDLKAVISKLKNVSMFVAELEEEKLAADQRRAWDLVEHREQNSSEFFEGTHHAVPDEDPSRLAEALLDLASLR